MKIKKYKSTLRTIIIWCISFLVLMYERVFTYFFTPSIKTRVLVWFGLVSSAILLLFSLAFYYFFNESINLKIRDTLYNKALFVKERIILKGSVVEALKDRYLLSQNIAIFKNEKILAKKGNVDFKQLKKKLSVRDQFYIFHKNESINAMYLLNVIKPFQMQILVYKRNMDDKVENVMDTLLVLEPILLLILIFLASRLIDKILIPIKKITVTANEITISDLSKSIKQPKDNDEIKALVNAFNTMIARLKDGVQKIQRFNNDVSHELKTPLTVIEGEIEITLDRQREPNEYIKSMKIIDDEAKQIQKIVDGLLLLTKYSKTNIKKSYQLCVMDSILLKVVEKYNQFAHKNSISLHLQRLEAISCIANAILLETIFSNLIDNAIKYTPKYKNIYISLYQDSKIHFIIKDEGIGIPKDKLSLITDRFYRVDESRNKKIKGFGLGLSIVKNSVELHGGELHIISEVDKGTTVHVEL